MVLHGAYEKHKGKKKQNMREGWNVDSRKLIEN